MADVPARVQSVIDDMTDAQLEVLRTLDLHPTNPKARTLLVVAERYGLDPLRGQIELIDTQDGQQVYITRKGYQAVARRTGELCGIRTFDYRKDDGGRPRTSARATVKRRENGEVNVYGAGGTVLDTEKRGRYTIKPQHAAPLAQTRALRRALEYAFSDVLPDPTADPDLSDDDRYEFVETEREPPAGDNAPHDMVIEPAAAESGGGRPSEPPPDTPQFIDDDVEDLFSE